MKKLIIFISLFIIILITSELVLHTDNELVKDYKSVTICDSLTLQNVYQELVNQQVKYPEIVLKQCILETGRLKSYNCRVRNNLFGFTLSTGYLKFASWKECVSYYSRWQKRHYKQGNYYSFLKKIGYAEDSLYVKKLNNINIERYVVNNRR